MTDLATKVVEADHAQQAQLETTPKTRTVLDLIRGRRNLYAQVLGKSVDPERFTRVALAVVGKNRQLMTCSQESLLGALMTAAQLGLEPGSPLGHAYLVPFGRDCTFIIGYKGYLELARRSGQVASIYAEPVFDGDEFTWSLGLNRDIVHKPTAADRTDYEKLTHVYAVAKLTDPNADPIFVVLTKQQVEARRKRSASAKARQSPWTSDPIPMACKSAVRALSPWLPMSIEFASAVAVDEKVVTTEQADLGEYIDVEAVEDTADDETPEPAAEA
jgi:recombination protein RecT